MDPKDLIDEEIKAPEEQADKAQCAEAAVDTELEKALKKADEYKDMAQRVQAEFDNYRRRNAEAVRNARHDGSDDVIMALLPVIDNFERGLQAVDESARTGIELIFKQVTAILEKFGVKEIEALGAAFNPSYHHAIAKCDDPEKENTVVEVFQKGYIRNNRVLRPAMVKVAQ